MTENYKFFFANALVITVLFLFRFGIFSCLPLFNTYITCHMFDFDHINFPAIKADLQPINWIEYLNVHADIDAM